MSEPRQVCQECGRTEIVRPDGRGFSPDVAKRRLQRACQDAGHTSKPQYVAGIVLTSTPQDQEAR